MRGGHATIENDMQSNAGRSRGDRQLTSIHGWLEDPPLGDVTPSEEAGSRSDHHRGDWGGLTERHAHCEKQHYGTAAIQPVIKLCRAPLDQDVDDEEEREGPSHLDGA